MQNLHSASFGESVSFDIDLFADDFKATELITYYHIKDTISDGFDYDFTENSNVTVTVTGTQEPISTVTLTEVASLDALKTAKSGYVILYDENDPRSFEVVVKWATLNSAGKQMPISPDEWNFIGVSYNATVNNRAVIVGSGNPSTASFTYDKSSSFDPENSPTEQPTPGENPENPNTPFNTTTYVYALGIEKVDAADKTKHLPGVKFTTTDFRAKKLSDGVYEVIPVEIDDTEELTAEYTEYFEVPESGFILIKGLGASEYTFCESETLAGYNLLAEPLVITIPTTGGTVGTVAETPYAAISKVENATGSELPSTGGGGTTIFFVSGSILVLMAGILLVTKKRMANGEQ